ncbi:hypothetical protein G7Y79_00008g024340 [Physcia stellaris]|nr:hypothetical protein G7Y79_00008g024340 [Physcia stellaris]
MAFNFNWSPLTADASFYTRAQELLTTALNKSPKPPIIVDDILVNQLNLGSIPPELEILEIGDLAEDRFRGIFKMCYSGDAYLTLKTRVQANPLNTYLSTRPSFTSPQPLAASSSLTIPLQITLSDFKLSAFIILVFSRQKGLTLVFRNDPLESLKVSSTFDSIPFVRDYLQKEIEGQLRTLLMDELPAIIHRLSLRLWVPEHRVREDEELARIAQDPPSMEQPVDPLASPPQDPVDLSGNALDPAQIASLSLDSGTETHSLFSQKNLLRLAALTDSHRTLSLFTPGIRDAVFRAWAGPSERGEPHTPFTPAMSRNQSYTAIASTTYSFQDNVDMPSRSVRPTLTSFGSAASGLGVGSSRGGKVHGGRKRKHRVVNLRKRKAGTDEMESVSGEGSTISGTVSSAPSDCGPQQLRDERDDELTTPPKTPEKPQKPWQHFQADFDGIDLRDTPPRLRNLTPRRPKWQELDTSTPRPPVTNLPANPPQRPPDTPMLSSSSTLPVTSMYSGQDKTPGYPLEKGQPGSSTVPLHEAHPSTNFNIPVSYVEGSSGSANPSGRILEQAWMLKMAGEIARKINEEKTANQGLWHRHEVDEPPPPAYGS